jgi:hypothetical protein
MAGTAIPIKTPNSLIEGDILKDKTTLSKGRNVSGRNWKLRPQKPASSLVTKSVQNAKSKSWEKKMKEKEQRK